MRLPSGENRGSRSSPCPSVSWCSPLPSGFITQMWKVPVVYDWNATSSPVGDQCGRDGSRKSSVSFSARPAVMGSDQRCSAGP